MKVVTLVSCKDGSRLLFTGAKLTMVCYWWRCWILWVIRMDQDSCLLVQGWPRCVTDGGAGSCELSGWIKTLVYRGKVDHGVLLMEVLDPVSYQDGSRLLFTGAKLTMVCYWWRCWILWVIRMDQDSCLLVQGWPRCVTDGGAGSCELSGWIKTLVYRGKVDHGVLLMEVLDPVSYQDGSRLLFTGAKLTMVCYWWRCWILWVIRMDQDSCLPGQSWPWCVTDGGAGSCELSGWIKTLVYRGKVDHGVTDEVGGSWVVRMDQESCLQECS